MIEQDHLASLPATHQFIREVSAKEHKTDGYKVYEAIDLLAQYHDDMPFDIFITSKMQALTDEFGDDAYSIARNAKEWHALLSQKEHSPGELQHAKEAIAIWKDVGLLLAKRETRQLARDLADLTGKADPETIKEIVASLITRFTVAELTKPAAGVIAATSMMKNMQLALEHDPYFYILPLITIAIAYLKTEQDIFHKKHHIPFITFETQVLTSILKKDLRKSAYFIRFSWLLPFLAPAVLTHIATGTDTSSYFIIQSLIYLGGMGIDACLAGNSVLENKR